MARYFFDTDEVGCVVRDDEGLELPSLDDAENEALAALGDIVKDALPHRRCRYIAMDVRDSNGTILVSLGISLQVERRV